MAVGHLWFRKGTQQWYATVDGKQVRIGAGGPDDKDKVLPMWEELRLKYEAEHGGDMLSPGSTVEDAWKVYDLAEVKKRTPRRQDRLRQLTAPFRSQFQDTQLRNVKSWQVETHINAQTQWSDTTRNMACKSLSMFFRWCVVRELIGQSPMLGWQKPQQQARDESAAIRPEEHAALLQVAKPYMSDILTTMHGTGARPSEVLTAQASDYTRFPNGKGKFTIWKHKTAHITKKPRTILLPSEVCDIIDRRIATQGEGPIFRGPTGAAITSADFQVRLKALARKAKIDRPIITYGYRHAWAMRMLRAGIKDVDVARMMGHKNTKQLHDSYSHLLDELEQNAEEYANLFDVVNAQPPTQ